MFYKGKLSGVFGLHKKREIKLLCLLGVIDKQIVGFLEVNVASIHRWKISEHEFCNSIKKRGIKVVDIKSD